ncbi:putative disease resistance protein RGA4 [Triticum dicoccoides]|uniref:putative disease resistance protein RGA4 n=1 Tax=Triticum dicoccoides TaxID=85692 RepID=UPI00188F1426|nr:putative disease resistance protein RGA4 [Triticum dicoccoides]XP_037416170.1 putative disease resistance protein RGA4 [Triticum dicoccoides]XP_037416171.1 putative disease resistance protein RGA4 [Triticum dicoccoides]XP_037416172.1 putative disease resistance protein RGA4 [Triticum dicoccoides]XP_037416173.1 putative disease resistance protein RGA4 [Triticum dicoccoides]XP_037416175.1 putative disease resistance protein RGA4 [Triticum dicoccoides]XP_037416176.1 putative disease resistanc
MAELVATMVVGPLLSIVKQKASSYLLDKYKVMDGMEEQHRVLKRKLRAILDIIADAEQAASHRDGAMAWLEEVKRVAYEANEVFDEFNYEALRREAKKNGHYVKLGFDAVKLFPTHNRFAFRNKMGKKLCRVLQSLEVLVAEMNAFGFKYQQQAPASKQWRKTDHVIFDPKEIISRSRSQDTKNIVATLLGHASNENLMVLPIVGVGGLGKTTLAQLIYNEPEVQKHFELLIWVCVSDNFDVDSLANSIVEAATPNRNTAEATSKKRPLDRLQDGLSGHRYLLVLDDVWNRESDKWEMLKARLTHSAKGSVVLITTRDGGVAKIMGSVKPYDLAGLEDDFIKEIIETRAFNMQKEEERPAVLVKMVGEIVKRCRGSPLAATALGSVLYTKTSEEEWKAISSRSNVCTEESGILPILKLSYNDLSAQMKQCFAFCAVFPKDYEIDVDKLIQLWIAHGFIQDQREVSLETIAKWIFSELTSRSFFVDVKQVEVECYEIGFIRCVDRYYKQTCKIHDLMHDVALSTMEKECALAPDKPLASQAEWLPDTARHLLLSCEQPETILNESLVKRSPAIQTLMCDMYMEGPLRHLSKYSSLKALRLFIRSSSFPLKSKHLHHLRYLDLSRSDIEALPEDISILHNLQTLNISSCQQLHRLPSQMSYMTSLRHLYNHGCPKIRSMPSDLRKLMSLQTLTCFAASRTGSGCSDVGELQHLNLGGQLELRRLENVTEEDAKAANLEKKKELRELTLGWTVGSMDDARVLEVLKPHHELQAVRINLYGGTAFPTWMGMLQNMVEIHLYYCKRVRWLFSCGTSFSFPNLMVFTLKGLECLKGLWEITNKEQGEEIIFQQLEKLCTVECGKLTALPEATLLRQSYGTMAPSAFPALKVLELINLRNFERWNSVVGSQGEDIIFPHLEKIYVIGCEKMTTLPGQQKVESPKLRVLDMEGSEEEMFLWVARHMTSLTSLKLKNLEDTETTSAAGADHSLTQVVDTMEKWNRHDFPLADMKLTGLKSGVTELCACFVQLQDLCIHDCAALVHWPEKEFQSLVFLRVLRIRGCKQLVGYTQAPAAVSSTSLESSSHLLPRLEFLDIDGCESMVELFKLPASLRGMEIVNCTKLKSTCSRMLQERQSPSSNLQGGSHVYSEVSPSSAVSRAEHFPFPCLEYIYIKKCDSLTGLLSLPPSLETIMVSRCDQLRSVESHSGEFPSLERLDIVGCKTLSSLPDGPQAYSSLQRLEIRNCPGIKRLPTCLQERLSSLEEKDLDGHYQEPSLMKPKTWRNAFRKD